MLSANVSPCETTGLRGERISCKLEKGQLVTGEVKSIDQGAAIEVENGQKYLRAQDVAREKVTISGSSQ